MGHQNVARWEKDRKIGPRPCDWCGCQLSEHKYIHQKCGNCKRHCYREEEIFYTRLGYDGDTGDAAVPPGYKVRIYRKGELQK